MKKNIDRTNCQSGSSLPSQESEKRPDGWLKWLRSKPFQESEERPDGWLKWLRSNMQMCKDLPITHPVEQGINR
jgi:hypothetical protein